MVNALPIVSKGKFKLKVLNDFEIGSFLLYNRFSVLILKVT